MPRPAGEAESQKRSTGRPIKRKKNSDGFITPPPPKKRGSGKPAAPTTPMTPPRHKVLSRLVGKLFRHKKAWPFLEPVNPVELGVLTYFDVIKHPMDLGTIQTKLGDQKYKNVEAVLADVRLVFDNALLFNPPGDMVHELAKDLQAVFEEEYEKVEASLEIVQAEAPPPPEPALSTKCEEEIVSMTNQPPADFFPQRFFTVGDEVCCFLPNPNRWVRATVTTSPFLAPSNTKKSATVLQELNTQLEKYPGSVLYFVTLNMASKSAEPINLHVPELHIRPLSDFSWLQREKSDKPQAPASEFLWLGAPVSVDGATLHYHGFRYKGENMRIGDPVVLPARPQSQCPIISTIIDLCDEGAKAVMVIDKAGALVCSVGKRTYKTKPLPTACSDRIAIQAEDWRFCESLTFLGRIAYRSESDIFQEHQDIKVGPNLMPTKQQPPGLKQPACALCRKKQVDRNGNKNTMFYFPELHPDGPPVALHKLCILHCPPAHHKGHLGPSGSYHDLDMMLEATAAIQCSHCGKPGASIACKSSKCTAVYHYPCLLELDITEDGFCCLCPVHTPSSPQVSHRSTAAAATAGGPTDTGGSEGQSTPAPLKLDTVFRKQVRDRMLQIIANHKKKDTWRNPPEVEEVGVEALSKTLAGIGMRPGDLNRIICSRSCHRCRNRRPIVVGCDHCLKLFCGNCFTLMGEDLKSVFALPDWECFRCTGRCDCTLCSNITCQMCRQGTFGNRMLLCDLCNRGWHMFCLTPPMTDVPQGEWACPKCTESGRSRKRAAGNDASGSPPRRRRARKFGRTLEEHQKASQLIYTDTVMPAPEGYGSGSAFTSQVHACSVCSFPFIGGAPGGACPNCQKTSPSCYQCGHAILHPTERLTCTTCPRGWHVQCYSARERPCPGWQCRFCVQPDDSGLLLPHDLAGTPADGGVGVALLPAQPDSAHPAAARRGLPTPMTADAHAAPASEPLLMSPTAALRLLLGAPAPTAGGGGAGSTGPCRARCGGRRTGRGVAAVQGGRAAARAAGGAV